MVGARRHQEQRHPGDRAARPDPRRDQLQHDPEKALTGVIHPEETSRLTTDNRIGPPSFASEREMLRAFLDYQRATLAMKCDGLSDDQLREQSMPPSTLSLVALLRHLAEVERAWFRRIFDDNQAPMVWSDQPMDFQAAFDTSTASGQEALDAWAAEVENSRRIERNAKSLDLAGYQPRWEEEVSLRMVMIHVLLEYGRHNGHADFLREGVDGTVGA
jgi:uncharacterized damage-inducible protein DinB